MFKNINYGVLLVEILPINWLKNWGYHQEVNHIALSLEGLLLAKVSTNDRTLAVNLLSIPKTLHSIGPDF